MFRLYLFSEGMCRLVVYGKRSTSLVGHTCMCTLFCSAGIYVPFFGTKKEERHVFFSCRNYDRCLFSSHEKRCVPFFSYYNERQACFFVVQQEADIFTFEEICVYVFLAITYIRTSCTYVLKCTGIICFSFIKRYQVSYFLRFRGGGVPFFHVRTRCVFFVVVSFQTMGTGLTSAVSLLLGVPQHVFDHTPTVQHLTALNGSTYIL